MVSEIEKRIKEHTAKVLSSNPPEPKGTCPRCLQEPGVYKLYDYRFRSFRYIVDNLVRIIQSYLLRWKCPLCRKPFTDYPDFAMPYKRYVTDDVEQISSAYVENADQTYQGVVLHQRLAIAYEQVLALNREPQLDKTTAWRWVGCLGTWGEQLKAVVEMIHRKEPDNMIFAHPVHVPKRKYRSSNRKRILENACLLLRAQQAWKRLYGLRIFPRIAPPAGRSRHILSDMG